MVKAAARSRMSGRMGQDGCAASARESNAAIPWVTANSASRGQLTGAARSREMRARDCSEGGEPQARSKFSSGDKGIYFTASPLHRRDAARSKRDLVRHCESLAKLEEMIWTLRRAAAEEHWSSAESAEEAEIPAAAARGAAERKVGEHWPRPYTASRHGADICDPRTSANPWICTRESRAAALRRMFKDGIPVRANDFSQSADDGPRMLPSM